MRRWPARLEHRVVSFRRPPRHVGSWCPRLQESQRRRAIEARLRELIVLYQPRSAFERARLYSQAEDDVRREAA